MRITAAVLYDVNKPYSIEIGGDGKPDPEATAFRELLDQDMRAAKDHLINVPY